LILNFPFDHAVFLTNFVALLKKNMVVFIIKCVPGLHISRDTLI